MFLEHLGAGSDVAENERLRDTLSNFERSIGQVRIALAAHSKEQQDLEREWAELEKAHEGRRRRLAASGSALRRVLEDLGHDIDILKHNFRRSMLRIDQMHK